MKKLALLLSMATCLFLFSFSSDKKGYQVGDDVVDFNLKNTKGEMISLASYKDAKGFIIVFTCNHCPFSVAYEDRIIALQAKYGAKGFPVVAINSNNKEVVPEDSYEEMIKRAAEKKFNFNYLYDSTQEIAHQFGAARTPHVFIVEKQKSNLKMKYIGAIDDNTDEPEAATKKYVESAVDEILAGKEVTTPMTKAIGCTIKWKK
ncbi:MAG: thioredoxin family protein [Bacteroidetes bacterium]|jgi:glutathione peroxidase-family protein|nr:thioredoxin family protein [Bacteroidota bacterium]